jgi:predicted 3-demethylubiquinone-9 3-methyltransferase (glyoxalase superfamily)
MKSIQKIIPFLWFNTEAEEAAKFYTSIFKNSKILQTTRYGDGMPLPKGNVMTVHFELDGQQMIALNGGPQFKFTEAISLVVNCEDQKELDYFWEKLSKGGQEVQCGWLKDKYGLSWQIVPAELAELIGGDQKKSEKVMQAVVRMVKLDIAAMKKARDS